MVTALCLCSLWAKRVGQQGEEAKSAGFVQEYLSILRHLVSEPLPSQQHICHKMVSLICTLRHHTDEVTCCAFSPSLLATSSGDKTLRVYTTADFSELPFSPLGVTATGSTAAASAPAAASCSAAPQTALSSCGAPKQVR